VFAVHSRSATRGIEKRTFLGSYRLLVKFTRKISTEPFAMLKSRPMGDGKQLYGNLRLDSKLVLLELGNSLQTIRLVGVRIVICTALLMTYDSDV